MQYMIKIIFQRLSGATLLVFANKQDLPGALDLDGIKNVRFFAYNLFRFFFFVNKYNILICF